MTESSGISEASRSWSIPNFTLGRFGPKVHKYALVIPVINEGGRIKKQLEDISDHGFAVDVVVADGGSTDGSMEPKFLAGVGITALLTKVDRGRLSSQLRIAYSWCLQEGYEGIITIDGNGKDDLDAVPEFVSKLESGFDYMQGSRYLEGGSAKNTPLERAIANRIIHAPLLSLAGKHLFSDTTNGYRAYSSRYLLDQRVQPFRNIFENYELLFYLTVRAGQIGMKVCQVPVTRVYPGKGSPVPTKINSISGKMSILSQTISAAKGDFAPPMNCKDYKGKSLLFLTSLFVMCALVLPALLLGHQGKGGLASDAIRFHLPQIEEFRKAPFNFFGYQPTAPTLPLYHFTLGAISSTFRLGIATNQTNIIRLFHFLISILGPSLLYRALFIRQALPVSFFLCLPVATSFYVLTGALYFGTDGPGYSVFLIALLALSGPSINLPAASLWTAILAATRHLYFPGLIGAAIARLFKARQLGRSSLDIMAVMAPASIVLIVYFAHWGGTTPPGEVSDLNPKGFFGYSILGQLGILGMWGFPYALVVWNKVVDMYRTIFARALFASLGSWVAILWFLSDTNQSTAQGRFGSLIWRLPGPIIFDNKSLAVLVMALVGVGTIAFYVACARSYALDPVPIATISATILSLGLTYAAYQRYSEPVIVACLSLMTASMTNAPSRLYWRFIPLITMSSIGLSSYIHKIYL